jgi:hypothetical protein
MYSCMIIIRFNIFYNFMLGWPCISNYMNNNPLDALFIFISLSYHTSKCFGLISSPSSKGRMYKCGEWYLLYYTVYWERAWPGQLTVSCIVWQVYIQLKVQLDVLITYSLFLSIFSSICFGCYCTHPQELQLYPTAIGMCVIVLVC